MFCSKCGINIPEGYGACPQCGQQAKLIAIDDVAFVGDGFYAVLGEADYQAIRTQLLGRS